MNVKANAGREATRPSSQFRLLTERRFGPFFGVQFLDKTVYYISELPSQVQRADVLLVAAIAFALTLLATLYPSWRAARINPAEALRYE